MRLLCKKTNVFKKKADKLYFMITLSSSYQLRYLQIFINLTGT